MKRLLIFSLVFTVLSSGFLFAEGAKKVKGQKEYLADLSPKNSVEVINKAQQWAATEKSKDALDKLIILMSDSRDDVRLGSSIALGYIGDEKGVDSLNKALLEDKNSDVRYAALLSSVRIGSKKSLKTWKSALERETNPFIKDFLVKMKKKATAK